MTPEIPSELISASSRLALSLCWAALLVGPWLVSKTTSATPVLYTPALARWDSLKLYTTRWPCIVLLGQI